MNPVAGTSPAIAASAALGHSEHQMKSFDGSSLFYRAWHPGKVRSRALILFHGGHEHSGRFDELVHSLGLTDVSVFAWDARGHGRSPGRRGHARHFHELVRDADCFVRHIASTWDIDMRDMIVLGHSVGSVIISTWLHDYAPPVRGAVLGSPAFNVKLYVPLALPGLKLLQKLRPEAQVNSYVRPHMLTHDTAEAEARAADPLISPKISVRVLTSLFDTAERVIAGAASIRTPVLILSAGDDYVVHRHAQERFFRNLGSVDKHMETLPGFYHEVFHEKYRAIPINRARAFIEKQFARDRFAPVLSLPVAKQDNRELREPLSLWSSRGLYYATTRAAIYSAGRLSDGIRIGIESGFDSGRTLDYVYRNSARGQGPLGRLIDRHYLNAIGWRCIRQRGENLQRVLDDLLRPLLMRGRQVHIMDIASGPGRYLLNTAARYPDQGLRITCRDQDVRGLEEGRRLAQDMALHGVVHEQADAFAPASYSGLDPAPDIVIASGLYELFSDNELLATSLAAIHAAMPVGGRLIFTNQPHHPQLELIARTLNNREQQPWVMRLRPQSEMLQLVREAGFTMHSTVIDDHGIFSVNVAVKKD